ncbi:MAG: glycosyltransferase, partial [Lachnospiraceae bacterium]
MTQNVLIVHNYYQIPGGEDTVVANEKKMLEAQGHKVWLYTRSNEELKTFGVFQKMALPFTTIYSRKTYREVKKLIRENNIDILHVHNTLSLISPSVYYAGFVCKIPVIQTMHNFRLLCPGAEFYRDGKICEDCVRKKSGLWCGVKHKCYRGSFFQTLASSVTLKLHRMLGTYRKLHFICLTEFNKEKLLLLNHRKKPQIDDCKVFVKPNFTYDPTHAQDCKKFVTENNVECGISVTNNAECEIFVTEKKADYYVYVGRLEEI